MITSRIHHWALLHPERTALICNDVVLSYASFWRMIEASRRFFERQDLPAGRTAVVLVHSLLDSWVIALGLRALGLDTIVVESLAQAESLGLKDVACVVATETEIPGRRLAGDALAGARAIVVPAAVFAGTRAGEVLFTQRNAPPFGGHILFTSGTTGTYKKVMLGGASEDWRNEARARSWSFGRDTVYHGMDFQLWTGAGFKQPSAAWHVGGCVVLDQRTTRLSNFFDYPITNATAVPSMLQALIRSGIGARRPAKDFDLAVGAGFVSLALAESAVRHLTGKLEIQYGATELATCALRSRFSGKDDLHWLLPADDCEVQIVDAAGAECAVGAEGELRIRTTDIDCNAYLDDAATSAKVFRDGFFHPGDIAVRRADGRIRILGRTADVLNIQGRKVAVAPIEQAMQQRLGGDEVCLFAGLNDRGEEEIVIAIEAERLPPGPDLRALRQEFESFERVRFVVLKAFPRATTGMRKVQRAALRKLAFAAPERCD